MFNLSVHLHIEVHITQVKQRDIIFIKIHPQQNCFICVLNEQYKVQSHFIIRYVNMNRRSLSEQAREVTIKAQHFLNLPFDKASSQENRNRETDFAPCD